MGHEKKTAPAQPPVQIASQRVQLLAPLTVAGLDHPPSATVDLPPAKAAWLMDHGHAEAA